MGVYFRPLPFVKLRITRRGVRAGIGPRWLRLWFGRGGEGVSTGAGPFTYLPASAQAQAVPKVSATGRMLAACSRKRRYPTRDAAEAAVRQSKRYKPAKFAGVVAYRCLICGQFHVGNPNR